MRTFTFSDAKSHKFWNIELTGTSYTVTYGKIGAKGQTSTKEFPSEEKALKAYEKIIKEKLSDGYVETTPSSSKSSRQVLEEALIADPSDRTTHAAYADLLSEEGDPKGEFIQVQLRLEDESVEKEERTRLKKRQDELLAEHERTWLGALAPNSLDKEGVEEWRRVVPTFSFEKGLLREINFPSIGVNQVRALIQSIEETRFLRVLRTGSTRYEVAGEDFEPGPDVPDDTDDYVSVRLLATWKNLGCLRVFQLGESVDDDEEYMNCHTEGELAHHLVKQMSYIEELRILAHRVDANKLFALPMPCLRILQLYHTDSYPLKKLAENPSLTKLEQLLFHPHAIEDEMPYGLSELQAVVKSPYLKNLTHLQMRMTIMGDAAVKAIVESGILKRMKLLDLSFGTVGDAGAQMLADCPDARNLSFLNLKSNELTEKGIQALQSLNIRLDVEDQHESTAEMDEDEIMGMEFLFSADIE